MEVVIASLITGICAVAGQWLISKKNRRDDEIKRAVLDERTKNRLDSIERKIDIHNGYAEKFGDISEAIAVIRTRIEGIEEKMR